MPRELGELILQNALDLLKYSLEKEDLQIGKIFNKASVIGRKIMLNIALAVDRLEFLLLFFEKSLPILEEASLTQSSGSSILNDSCEPILELVQRLYTDE